MGERMCSKNKAGQTVYLHYRGGVRGEEPVDDRSTGEPLVVVLGDLRLPRGIEEAVMEMDPGQECTIEISPERGYGRYQERLVQWYPKPMLKDGYSLKIGDVLFYSNPEDGSRQPGFVTDLTQDAARIDFNHPFAGKTLEYWIRLEDVR